MEQAEEFYRTLCSLETLRSGKKGFFSDFSDRVMDVAGDRWISKVFGRLNSDEDRIRAVFGDEKIKDAVSETLNRTKTLYRGKDANASRARRLEGYEAATAGERQKALLLFSQAVLRAPPAGKCETVDRGLALPLALLGRADALIASNEYALALEDLSFVDELPNLPDKLKLELAQKKKECESFLRANEKSLVSAKELFERRRGWRTTESKPPAGLSGGENPRLPSASALLEIEETKSAGKRAIAAKEIAAGDVLVVEPPLAATLLPDFFGTHCHHCFSRFRAPIGCPNCSSVAFCGRQCRDTAMATYHNYECKILALLIGSGMSVLSTLAFRMVTQIGPTKCLEVCSALNRRNFDEKENGNVQRSMEMKADTETETETETETVAVTGKNANDPSPKASKSAKRRSRKKKWRDSHRRGENLENEKEINANERTEGGEKEKNDEEKGSVDLRAYDLVTHEKRRTAKDLLERSLMAAFLLRCLQRVGFFEKPTKDEEPPNAQEVAVAGLLLKHLQLLQFNAHEVFETRLGMEHRFRGSRPVYLGVAIYPTVARFNHDCYPAVSRYFVGRCIVIRAIRPLQPGDVVAENYGPIFTKKTLDERQRTLAGRYWFRCECTACREDWPRFETLSNELVRLRCPIEGCEKLHKWPREPKKKLVVCSSCRRKVDLRGCCETVRECEQLYARGFTAMDEEQPEKALQAFLEGANKFHRVAAPPHKDAHLAEIAASACMADAGNVWQPNSLF